MAAGADSIDDMDLLRHGAMSTLFGGIRAPSTLGSRLRSYTWGNVVQLEKAGFSVTVPMNAGIRAAGGPPGPRPEQAGRSCACRESRP
jgi:hypothetical protein